MVTQISALYDVKGAMAGELELEGLVHVGLLDRSDDQLMPATYRGFSTFRGVLDGRIGSFVMEGSGTYSAVGLSGQLTIKRGGGRGALSGIVGTGSLLPDKESDVVELAYSIEPRAYG
jgi:hypothetical protein